MFIKRDKASTITEVVMRNTGLDLNTYLNPDPMPYIHNLDQAVGFFKNYVADHPDAPVTIVGDYDADGINATAILYHAIFKYMRRPPKTRLPYRFTEGYGLSVKIVEEIDSGLIITCDNGITAAEAIHRAKEKGLAVIVTDHHLAPVDAKGKRILPDADVIVDPNAEDESPFKGYCGAGLAYRFAQELLPGKNLKKLLVFASIATVADVMPITGANWLLVRDGLKAINARRCMPGLKMLLEKQEMGTHLQADDYGFGLGPVFNASGRLEDNGSGRVLEVMKVTDRDPKAVRLPWMVDKLVENNQKRKELVKEALSRVSVTGRPIVYYDPTLGEGIIGIIAGHLAEEYHCPAIVFTRASKEGVLKGSGRSIPEIHLKDALDQIQDEMLGYGGHAGAAGLSIAESNLEHFREAFSKACGSIPRKPEHLYYDLILKPSMLADMIEEQKRYAPFGEGNPKPVFRLLYSVDPENYRTIGDGTHFMVKGNILTVMGFGMTEKYESLGSPELLDCIGYISEDWYNDKCTYKFELIDFEPVQRKH